MSRSNLGRVNKFKKFTQGSAENIATSSIPTSKNSLSKTFPKRANQKLREKSTKYSGLYTEVLKDGDLSFIGRFKIHGKNKRASLGRRSEGMTLESAYVLRLQMMEEARQKISMEEDSVIGTPTLSDVFEEYLEAKRLHNGKPMNSEGRTLSIFKANFKSIKTKQIHQIDEKDLRKIRYELLSKGRSMKTVYNYLSLIRTIFIFNNKRNRILSQQINWSEIIPKPSEFPQTTERLTDDEMNSLMLALDEETPQVKNLFLFAIYTGMRKSELFKLQWGHVKWENGHIHIPQPKSRRANEKLTMTSGMKIIPKNQMDVVENSEFPDKELGYVFYTPNGLCWKEKSRSIQIVYQRLRDKTGITNFRMMHGLRHHFGSTHAAKGTPLPTLQRLLRHGSTSMTMRYITIFESENIEAAEKIEKIFDSQRHEAK